MKDEDLRERYRALSRVTLPDDARARVRTAIRGGRSGGRRTHRGTGGAGWWIAAGAVAAGLLTLALTSHAPNVPKPAHQVRPLPLAVKTPFASVDMLSTSTGWAVGAQGQIAHTSDGGAQWLLVTPPDMPQGAPASVVISLAATDATHAWVAAGVVGSNYRPMITVFYTTDGGASWQRAATGKYGTPQVRFVSNSTGYMLLHEGAAAGSEGVLLLRTTDGGAHWAVAANGQPTAINPPTIFGGDKSGFGFLNPMRGWLTGEWAANSILLYATADGGKSWTRPLLPVPAGLNADGGAAQSEPPQFFGADGGVLPVQFGNPGLPVVFYQTTDGGATWTPTTPLDGGANFPIYSVVSQSIIVASDSTKVYVSADGGRSWSSFSPNVSLQGLTELDFTSLQDGWAVVQGRLLRTVDGGHTWSAAVIK